MIKSKVCLCGLMEMAPGFIALNQDNLSVGYAHMDVHKALMLCF